MQVMKYSTFLTYEETNVYCWKKYQANFVYSSYVT